MTKTQFIQALSDKTGFLTRQQANLVLESLSEIVQDQLKTEGKVVIPDLVKVSVKEKAATEERQGVNPFTKKPITIPAKPASKKVSATPVSTLKRAFGT